MYVCICVYITYNAYICMCMYKHTYEAKACAHRCQMRESWKIMTQQKHIWYRWQMGRCMYNFRRRIFAWKWKKGNLENTWSWYKPVGPSQPGNRRVTASAREGHRNHISAGTRHQGPTKSKGSQPWPLLAAVSEGKHGRFGRDWEGARSTGHDGN